MLLKVSESLQQLLLMDPASNYICSYVRIHLIIIMHFAATYIHVHTYVCAYIATICIMFAHS